MSICLLNMQNKWFVVSICLPLSFSPIHNVPYSYTHARYLSYTLSLSLSTRSLSHSSLSQSSPSPTSLASDERLVRSRWPTGCCCCCQTPATFKVYQTNVYEKSGALQNQLSLSIFYFIKLRILFNQLPIS